MCNLLSCPMWWWRGVVSRSMLFSPEYIEIPLHRCQAAEEEAAIRDFDDRYKPSAPPLYPR